MPSRPTHPLSGSRRGRLGHRARALAQDRPSPLAGEVGDRHRLSGEPLTRTCAVGELQVGRVDLQLLGRELEQLVADLARGLASRRGRC